MKRAKRSKARTVRSRRSRVPAMHGSGGSLPLWLKGARDQERAGLREDLSCDVCVIGAGFSGLSTAYRLAGEGRSVVLLERAEIAGGESGRSTAHLSTALDWSYARLESTHGPGAARTAAESHAAAIDWIERAVDEERIACDFSRLNGFLFGSAAALEREWDAARRLGIGGLAWESRPPIEARELGPCLRFSGQGQLHPVRYLTGLARAFEKRGGRLFGRTAVVDIQSGRPAAVATEAGPVVRAGAVVVATDAPINDRVAIAARMAPYRTYVIACRVPAGRVAKALYWDNADPYHYARVQKGGGLGTDLLIVGGEDHRVAQAGDAEQRYARLEAWARWAFPMIKTVERRWSGQIQSSDDGLALIGPHPTHGPGIFVATGDTGTGTTYGTIAGLLLGDLILGRNNPWASLYSPSRVVPAAAGQFLREQAKSALGYLRYATAGEVDSADDIAPGSGAVLRRGLAKVAVYKAPDGTLTECSAVCPHLGGIVSWNEGEKTWDCPVHGSRYDPQGRPLNGPAPGPLAPAQPTPPPPYTEPPRSGQRPAA